MNIKDIKHNLVRNIKTYKDELLDTKELSLPAKKDFVDIFQGVLVASDTSFKKISEQILPKKHKYRNHQIITKDVSNYFEQPYKVGHWFRKDKSGSVPKAEDWWKLKKILKFDDRYDKTITTFNETVHRKLRTLALR